MEVQIKILLPAALVQFTGERSEVVVRARTVREALDHLVIQYPKLKQNILADDGSVRKFINLYVNTDDVRFLQKGDTRVKEGDVVSIIPSIAGG